MSLLDLWYPPMVPPVKGRVVVGLDMDKPEPIERISGPAHPKWIPPEQKKLHKAELNRAYRARKNAEKLSKSTSQTSTSSLSNAAGNSVGSEASL
jgi:hypothetical protein